MNKHTPIPWHWSRHQQDRWIYDHNHQQTICKMVSLHDNKSQAESQADMEFIVRACNNHERLVEALKHLRDEAASRFDGIETTPSEDKALEKATEVLASLGL